MKIYKIAKEEYRPEIVNNEDFIGFHCQQDAISPSDGIIQMDDTHGYYYYLTILYSLPPKIKEKASEKGLLNKPPRETDKFDEWVEDVAFFLSEQGVRWIFVNKDKPLSEDFSQGEGEGEGEYTHQYYVLLPKLNRIGQIDVSAISDEETAYVYNISSGQPQCIEMNLGYDLATSEELYRDLGLG